MKVNSLHNTLHSPVTVWLPMWQDNKNDHTHNLLNLLNAFVNVQLHILGDPPKCSTGECYSDKGERNLVFLMPSQPWWLYQSVRQKYMLPDWNIANKPRALYVPWEEHLIYRLRTNTSNYLTTLPNVRPAQMVPTSFPGVIRALPPTFIFFIALQGHLFQTSSKAKHKHEKKTDENTDLIKTFGNLLENDGCLKVTLTRRRAGGHSLDLMPVSEAKVTSLSATLPGLRLSWISGIQAHWREAVLTHFFFLLKEHPRSCYCICWQPSPNQVYSIPPSSLLILC